MGADSSRFYSQAEESIDAYINRGGARLVNRERRLTTSTTIDIGIGGTAQFSVSYGCSTIHITLVGCICGSFARGLCLLNISLIPMLAYVYPGPTHQTLTKDMNCVQETFPALANQL